MIHRPTFARVDLDALSRNFRTLAGFVASGRAAAGQSVPGVIGVVKANAYGHGAVAVGRALEAAGASMLACADIAEGVILREGGITVPILIFGALSVGDVEGIFDYGLTPTVSTPSAATTLEAAAARRGVRLSCHLKIDTGMNRLGFRHDQLDRTMPPIAASSSLAIEGLYTHFATADVPDDPLFGEQRTRFAEARRTLAGLGIRPRVTHMANSAAMLRDERVWFDYVRPGLLLYGLVPPPLATTLPLEPVMSLSSKVVSVKGVRPGEGVSYGMRFRTDVPRRIAVVPAGYADGIDTRCGNRGVVLVRGRRVSIVGAICMDMMMIDVTDVEVEPGDDVVIVGAQGSERLDVREIAATIGAIPWELLCRVGSRIERVYAPVEPANRPPVGDNRGVVAVKPQKTVYACQSCGAQSPKWLGRCAECGAWNTLVEERAAPTPAAGGTEARYATPVLGPGRSATAQRYADVSLSAVDRISTGLSELDRVLGGGVVPGSLVLLGGEPGIGKSTLLLQAAAHFAKAVGPVLYASGEESEPQIKARGERLGVGDDPLYLFAETCLERVLDEAVRLKPALLILDSIQTVFSTKLQSAPGSVAQVREAATQLLFAAKGQHVPTFIIGHVTKDGALAGPKVLEHVVDTVLYFEGERHHAHRVVRAVKNRFGAASEVGVFEMTGVGLKPVPNPSALFLAERPARVAGSAVLCAVEGSRPLLVEVQALVSTSTYGYAKRTANGLDANRLSLLLAVLEKRAGLVMSGDDVFANVAGGLSVDEPAVDLAVVAALASSLRNRPVRPMTALFGEVGLAGEVRRATHAPLRVREAARLGFTRVILPPDSVAAADVPAGVTLVPVASVGELLDALYE